MSAGHGCCKLLLYGLPCFSPAQNRLIAPEIAPQAISSCWHNTHRSEPLMDDTKCLRPIVVIDAVGILDVMTHTRHDWIVRADRLNTDQILNDTVHDRRFVNRPRI